MNQVNHTQPEEYAQVTPEEYIKALDGCSDENLHSQLGIGYPNWPILLGNEDLQLSAALDKLGFEVTFSPNGSKKQTITAKWQEGPVDLEIQEGVPWSATYGSIPFSQFQQRKYHTTVRMSPSQESRGDLTNPRALAEAVKVFCRYAESEQVPMLMTHTRGALYRDDLSRMVRYEPGATERFEPPTVGQEPQKTISKITTTERRSRLGRTISTLTQKVSSILG
jgi:hypothetical protein